MTRSTIYSQFFTAQNQHEGAYDTKQVKSFVLKNTKAINFTPKWEAELKKKGFIIFIKVSDI